MTPPIDILERIARYKRQEIKDLQSRTSLDRLKDQALAMPPTRGFKSSLTQAARSGPAIIAEVKKASPSKGIIRSQFDPIEISQTYEVAGATCLSVLTDAPSFMGSADIFQQVRKHSSLPLIRKDFMLEPIQIAESRAMGADAILIILSMVDDKEAHDLLEISRELGMDALIETHNIQEIKRALHLGGTLIGINNRNLRTFETSLDVFEKLAQYVPHHCTLVAESGIYTSDDILRLTSCGAEAFLVGESLMRQDNIYQALKQLKGELAS